MSEVTTLLPQADLGHRVPSDWILKEMRSLGEVKTGLTYKPEDVAKHGTLVLRSSNIQDERLVFEDNVFVSKKVGDGATVRKGDILICVRNGSRRLIGKSALITAEADGMAFGAFMSAFRSDLSPYLIWVFQSEIVQRQIEENLGATINQITNATLKALKVPMPPPHAQQAIAAALSDADGVVAGLERVIAKKRLIKQGAMQDLLTARRRLPGFSGEWEEATISDVAHVDPEALGAGTPKDYAFRYISLEDVNQGVLSGWTDVSFGSAPSRARRILQKDDVLLGTVRPNLKSHMLFDRLGADWIGSTGFAVLRPRPENCNPGYLFELIMSDVIGRQIDEVIAGSNYPAISNSDVRKLKVMLPTIEEQKAIASVLRDMDAEIQTLESRLAKARAVKEGMMQNLLTGRVRLA